MLSHRRSLVSPKAKKPESSITAQKDNQTGTSAEEQNDARRWLKIKQAIKPRRKHLRRCGTKSASSIDSAV